MKITQLSLIGVLAAGLLTGCAGLPKHMAETTRIETAPPGQALINFHRPTSYGKTALYPVFDGNGKFICDVPGNSVFQYACPPGQHLFIGWADHVTVVDANVAADKIYDIMLDVGMGWIQANIRMEPLAKGDPRRAKLAEFQKREKHVLAIRDTKYVTEYEAKNQGRVKEIKGDFLGGQKSERVRHISTEDCR